MAYRRKGSGKPSSGAKASSSEPSRSDEPPSAQGADPEPLRMRGTGSEPGGNTEARVERLGIALRQASGQALPSSGQALRGSGQALRGSGQALRSSGQALRSSGQASVPAAAKLPTPNAGHSACGPKGPEESPSTRCSICGHRAELFELPGRTARYCLECSADVATSHLLATEIDAATMAGQDANALITEFELLSCRLLARAQSA